MVYYNDFIDFWDLRSSILLLSDDNFCKFSDAWATRFLDLWLFDDNLLNFEPETFEADANSFTGGTDFCDLDCCCEVYYCLSSNFKL